MMAAAAQGSLEGAAAVELLAVKSGAAADWLASFQTDPPPPLWGELLRRLRADGDSSPIAQALSTPLALTLIRAIYTEPDSIGEFLKYCDSATWAITSDDLVAHLLGRFLQVAYAKRSGRYDLAIARVALSSIADQMSQNGTYDLEWWRISEWVPQWPRRAVVTVACTALAVLAVRFNSFLVMHAAARKVYGHGLMSGIRRWLIQPNPLHHWSIIPPHWTARIDHFATWIDPFINGVFRVYLFICTLVVAAVISGMREHGLPLRLGPIRLRGVSHWPEAWFGPEGGYVPGGLYVARACALVGLAAGLVATLYYGPEAGAATGLGAIAISLAIAGIVFGHVGAGDSASLGPLASWRGDLAAAVLGGPIVALVVWPAVSIVYVNGGAGVCQSQCDGE
jgi:hypothetical protein